MKRKIIFRGWNIKYKCWDYVNNPMEDCALIDQNSVGQYTGLKDKNGREIYEGDILKFIAPDGTIRYFVVEWASEDRILRPLSNFVPDGNPVRINGWCFNWNGHRLYPTVIDGVPDNEAMEIVGNIHDNPELMKGGSNEA